MTEYGRIRRAMYFSAAVSLLWPVSVLGVGWNQQVAIAPFLLMAVMLPAFLLISRWDLVGYGLQHVFFLLLLLVAYRKTGCLLPLVCLSCLAVLWVRLRRTGGEDA